MSSAPSKTPSVVLVFPVSMTKSIRSIAECGFRIADLRKRGSVCLFNPHSAIRNPHSFVTCHAQACDITRAHYPYFSLLCFYTQSAVGFKAARPPVEDFCRERDANARVMRV